MHHYHLSGNSQVKRLKTTAVIRGLEKGKGSFDNGYLDNGSSNKY
jgi:hypothetical protein